MNELIGKWDWTDVVDKMFDKKQWETVPDKQKKDHFHMTMRIIAIRYPVEACKFDLSGMTDKHVLDFFASYLQKNFRSKPSWTYNKSISRKDKKLIELKLDKDLVSSWANRHNLSTKDLNFLLDYFPEEVKTETKALEKAMKV